MTARNNSVEALNTFRDAPDAYDLVITDHTMPHLTGTQLAQFITSIRRDIPIILCTGFCEMMSAEQIHALGIRRFVTKPVLCNEFSHVVKQVLEEVLA